MAQVSIIIPHYNVPHDLLECIASLSSLNWQRPIYILIVDNNSSSFPGPQLTKFSRDHNFSLHFLNQFEALSISFRHCKSRLSVFVVLLDDNLGFGAATNIGLLMSLKLGADFTWILNPDTIVSPSALTELIKVADTDGTIGIVGSKLHCYPQKERVQFDGTSVIYQGLSTNSDKNDDHAIYTTFVSGASMLVKTHLVRQIGLFREDYFLYFEDSEYCIRAIKHKFKVAFAPSSIVYHKGGTSIGSFLETPVSVYYAIRNCLFFVEEFLPGYMQYLLRKITTTFFLKLWEKQSVETIEAFFDALEHFAFDIKGKREMASLDYQNPTLKKLFILRRAILSGQFSLSTLYFEVLSQTLKQLKPQIFSKLHSVRQTEVIENHLGQHLFPPVHNLALDDDTI